MALYARLAADLEEAVVGLPDDTVATRWSAVLHHKLDLLTPHRRALRALVSRGMDPDNRIGVLGRRTEVIRSRVSAVFATVVSGASDAPPAGLAEPYARLLYGLHLAVILLWTQGQGEDDRRARRFVDLTRSALVALRPMLYLPGAKGLLGRVDGVFGDLLQTASNVDREEVARTVLRRVFARRRLAEPGPAWNDDPAEIALHLPRVLAMIEANEPIHLVLPAFPAKSPNPRKVVGTLPDLAEALALENLQALCDEIGEAWEPGARITICSDGHVFADLVEVSDENITAYNDTIARFIDERGLSSIDLFDMRDMQGPRGFDAARDHLLDAYALPIDDVRDRAKDNPHHARMVDGIHRFLTEDAVGLHPDWSKTKARKAMRERAYAVVQRSDAWGRLVATCFPDALRLSIHPQPRVSPKIGIHLLDTDDVWLTPWHGVALLGRDGARLVKRHQAEAAGAELHGSGTDAHFVLEGG